MTSGNFDVIPDNAHRALIRNLDRFGEIPGSRFARPGMTACMIAYGPCRPCRDLLKAPASVLNPKFASFYSAFHSELAHWRTHANLRTTTLD